MRCCIRPLQAFSPAERVELQRWVNEIRQTKPDLHDLVECRGDTILVQADESLANDLAIASMMVIGRPFQYRVITVGKSPAETLG
jgi:hypothetical protein